MNENDARAQRLQMLEKLDLDDGSLDRAFEKTTRLAQDLLNVDVAAVSFVGDECQWFRAPQGTDVRTMPIEQSTCQYALQQDGLFELEDLREDPRIPTPIEADGRELRHYAGVPLRFDDGVALGTLCTLGEQPGTLTEDQQKILELLAEPVTRQLQQFVSNHNLQHSVNRLNTTLEATGDGIFGIDQNNELIVCNDNLMDLFEISREYFETSHELRLHAISDPLEQPEQEKKRMRKLIFDRPELKRTDDLQFKDGRIIERFTAPRYEEGELAGRLWRFRDVTDQRSTQARVEFLATHDPVTELPSRRTFLKNLQTSIEDPTTDQLAVGVAQIYRFPRVEEATSHDRADRILHSLARTLRQELSPTVQLSVLERGTFAIAVNDENSKQQVQSACRTFQQLIDDFSEEQDLPFVLRLSCGISQYPEHGQSAEKLLRLANRAMREAESSAGQSLQVFFPELAGLGDNAKQLEKDFERALSQDGLKLQYQPRIDLESETMVGAESLIRWDHPKAGSINPGEILDLAEMTDNEFELDKFVLKSSLEQLEQWGPEAIDDTFSLSINLTFATFLKSNDFMSYFRDLLANSEIASNQIEIELTEQNAMEDVDHTTQLLKQVRAEGTSVALDDFGTGFSSLEYLTMFPLDVLKVDRYFVSEVDTSENKQKMIRSILQFGDVMDLDIVAEGPEREEEIDFLKQQNCDFAQGYYYSKPLPPNQLVSFMNTNGYKPKQPVPTIV